MSFNLDGSNSHQNSDADTIVTLRISRFSPVDSLDIPTSDATDNTSSCNSEESTTGLIRRTHTSPFAKKSSSPFRDRKSRSNPFGKLDKKNEDSCEESSEENEKNSQATDTADTSNFKTQKMPGKHWVQDYTMSVKTTDTILDCLLTIKRTVDPTLAFRYSCGHGVCGSDAANVNGMPTLLCSATVGANARHKSESGIKSRGFRKTGSMPLSERKILQNVNSQISQISQDSQDCSDDGNNLGIIEISPLSGFAVQRDLICDISPMISQIKRLEPYLKAAEIPTRNSDGKLTLLEFLQNPEQLQKFELLSNCIMCGACEAICPIYAGGEAFIGPAALINAARFIYDSRDTATNHRLDLIDSSDGISACQSVRACSRQCPRGIDIGEEIWQLTTLINERKSRN